MVYGMVTFAAVIATKVKLCKRRSRDIGSPRGDKVREHSIFTSSYVPKFYFLVLQKNTQCDVTYSDLTSFFYLFLFINRGIFVSGSESSISPKYLFLTMAVWLYKFKWKI